MLWSSWTGGQESGMDSGGDSGLFVSVTNFQARRTIDIPFISFDGWKLKRRWHELPGAIGMWLWVDLPGRRAGSISVWRDEADMQNFVRWKPHMEIASRYRRSGRMSSTSWTVSRLDRRAIRNVAARWLRDVKPGGTAQRDSPL